jgi:hypothetical protein
MHISYRGTCDFNRIPMFVIQVELSFSVPTNSQTDVHQKEIMLPTFKRNLTALHGIRFCGRGLIARAPSINARCYSRDAVETNPKA